MTGEGSYYPGWTNAEGPAPTHGRTKQLPIFVPEGGDPSEKYLHEFLESYSKRRANLVLPPDHPLH